MGGVGAVRRSCLSLEVSTNEPYILDYCHCFGRVGCNRAVTDCSARWSGLRQIERQAETQDLPVQAAKWQNKNMALQGQPALLCQSHHVDLCLWLADHWLLLARIAQYDQADTSGGREAGSLPPEADTGPHSQMPVSLRY